jgi:hypothetical protein
MNNQELIAPCGVYCGVCPQRIAHKSKNEKLKEKLAANYGLKPEDISCDGCNSKNLFLFCVSCEIKSCVQKKEIESCAECKEFPCEIIDNFSVKQFIEKVKWDVNYRREHGKDHWIAKSIELNTCPSCQSLNHWVAKRCISCKDELPKRY